MEASTSTNSLMSRARRRPAAAAGAGLRPPAAAFEVRLEHDHHTIVEENARENLAVLGQLRNGVSPATVEAIYFPSLKLLTAAESGRIGALRSVREGFGPSTMNRRHWR